jgi:pimeloyl-ACP methyl ester carboxylesterase
VLGSSLRPRGRLRWWIDRRRATRAATILRLRIKRMGPAITSCCSVRTVLEHRDRVGVPEAHRLFERLGRFARVIRYDRRDSGLSDPIKDDLTLEAHGRDAVAVIEATGARRPVLVGATDGARSLALLAATQPELVGGLIPSTTTRTTAVNPCALTIPPPYGRRRDRRRA